VDFLASNNANLRGAFLFRTITVRNNLNAAYDVHSPDFTNELGGRGAKRPRLVK
jgi:hypothetical protein